MKYNIPIIVVQAYLTFTLYLFQFGPISYHVESPLIFWGYIFLYQASFLLGYLMANLSKAKIKKYYRANNIGMKFSKTKFWILVVFAIIASVITFKGGSAFDMFNPYYWYESAISGLKSPVSQYQIKMARVISSENTGGNKPLSSLLFILAFSKVLIIPALVYFWDRLGNFSKLFAFFVSCLPVLVALSNGTNKYIFDFAVFYTVSLSVFFIKNYYSFGNFGFKKRKFFLIIIFIAGLGAFFYFGLAMQGRGGSVTNIESFSPLGDIKVKEIDTNWDDNFVYTTYVWFANYLVQGYYGFSLSLSQDFTSTLGFGNSTFLSRQFEWVTGMNLSNLTYQHKIDQWWGEKTQWHSFYSQYANDFHFSGVPFICLLLGFYLARLWISIIDNGNFYAALIMPLFALLVIFIPANNQIFGFLETFSAFCVASILWFYTMYIKPGKRLRGYAAHSSANYMRSSFKRSKYES